MRKIVINGGRPLQGEITISGAKNSVVALIPAIILSDDIVTLDCVPDISDVASLVEIMEIMGATVKRYEDVLEIDPRGVQNIPMPYGKINSLRASYYFYGSLLGRFGEATVGLPGGCDLGPRPIDLHLKAFEAMGAKVSYEGDNMNLSAQGKGLHGASIYIEVGFCNRTTQYHVNLEQIAIFQDVMTWKSVSYFVIERATSGIGIIHNCAIHTNL